MLSCAISSHLAYIYNYYQEDSSYLKTITKDFATFTSFML